MVLASAAVIVALANPAQSNQLGTVNFPTSCSSAVQPTIERAVALLHSFQYEEAAQALCRSSSDPSDRSRRTPRRSLLGR